MGTAVGRGSVFAFSKKHRAWDRYSMTGGACAGFSVATGAPISGIMFALEEAHQRISPMIVIVAVTSVISSMFTAEVISPIFGVNVKLFPDTKLLTLTLKDIWLPFLIGLLLGLFAVVFLKLYQIVSRFFGKRLAAIKPQYKIFGIFSVTVLVGLFSFSFISTGHELILELFHSTPAFWLLILLLLVRTLLTLSANCNNLTGGIFLPILAIGTVAASLLGKAAETILGLGHDYYTLILVFGITACIAGMMKSPLTAVFFAIEALSCYNNLLYVILTAAVAFIITELFAAESINDSVLEHRMRRMGREHPPLVKDTYVTVQDGAFAIGKQVRDIFWPANLFVLSVRHAEEHEAQLDRHGGNLICEKDILHIRYSTYDTEKTLQELYAIVGKQEESI
jgi:H+/Cl- antiporter ClcA